MCHPLPPRTLCRLPASQHVPGSQAWAAWRQGLFLIGFHLVGFSRALTGTYPCLSPPKSWPPVSVLPASSPFLASPVPRPPPSTSGLTSVSFALFCSLTGIIKIRINRQVSISSLSSSSSCLVDWLCPGLSQRLWLAVSFSLSLSPSFPSPGTECQPPIPAACQGLPRLKTVFPLGDIPFHLCSLNKDSYVGVLVATVTFVPLSSHFL